MLQHRQLILSTLLLLMLLPSIAFTQDYGVAGSIGVLSTTTYGGATTTGVGTTVGVIFLLSPSKSSAQLELYLRQNRAQVEQALYLGAGAASQDLAHIFGVSTQDYPAFAALLKQRRAALLATIAPEAIRADLFIAQLTTSAAP